MLQDYLDSPLFDQLPGYVCLKDINARYLRANHRLAALSGFKNQEQLTGITDADLKCSAAESADLYIKQDLEVIRTGDTLRLVCFDIYHNDEPKLLTGIKSPIRDENDVATGLLIQGQELIINDFARILIRVNDSLFTGKPVTFEIRDNYQLINLSQRECECLFYLLRGFSASEISGVLNLSKRTIESYVDNIKSKMHCNSKKDIFEKAHELGFAHVLPITVLQKIANIC